MVLFSASEMLSEHNFITLSLVSPEEMEDPEVKSFMEKFQEKLGPLMGMMGGT